MKRLLLSVLLLGITSASGCAVYAPPYGYISGYYGYPTIYYGRNFGYRPFGYYGYYGYRPRPYAWRGYGGWRGRGYWH